MATNWTKVASMLVIYVAGEVMVSTTSAALLAAECTPNQEFFCKNASSFAWCEDERYVETCHLDLLCDHTLEYLCKQELPSFIPTHTTTESTPDEPPSDYDDVIDDSWDIDATPPPSCTKPGRFQDNHDCTAYHLCVPNIEGNLTHMVVTCPTNSHYSADMGRCTIPERAKCDPETLIFTCPSTGRVPDPTDCSSFILCLPEGIWRRYHCPNNSYFNPQTLKCSSSKDVCQPLQNNFNCTKRGLFQDLKDCRKFHYCIPSEKIFRKGFAYCPKTSVFNPKTSRCTTNVTSCNKVEKFCKNRRPGKYSDSENCSTFHVCSAGDVPAGSYKCPYGSHFDAKRSRCVYESKSTCGRADRPCTEAGKFADLDNNCSGFYVCVMKHHTWIKQHYQCPGESRFNTDTKKCALNSTACYETVNALKKIGTFRLQKKPNYLKSRL